ncbi:telomerase-binding protein EST1A [Anopheles ziemanni]|uniref:telomerase-binding protein EST1A n=1 Tax=Anopheles coustani TaxID=139045 RepID=UPI00265A0810|nr:telomerase-binding protein EST1A [Anopheles coustani]XP_058126853.1 telomerase-binding protein EST1A [Anopheles coustani]XP_058176285.1 telomerase-binding protein EST1A [Anopheles ziemanni]
MSRSARVEMRSASAKREQQLYSPGSGPLRKTQRTDSNRSLNANPHSDPSPPPVNRLIQRGSAGGRNSNRRRSPSTESYHGQEYGFREARGPPEGGSINRRLEVHAYPPASGNHTIRLESEPPPSSMSSNAQTAGGMRNVRSDQMNRDARGSKKKPPIPSLSHLENLPPRLQKKTLQEHGLPPDYLEKMRAEQQRAQTLPIRGSNRHSRGRIRYSGSGGGGGGGPGPYPSNTMGSRPMVEEYHSHTRSRSSDVGSNERYPPWPNAGDRPREHQSGRADSRNSSCERNDRDRTYSGGSKFRHYSSGSSRGQENSNNDNYSGSSTQAFDDRRESINGGSAFGEICDWAQEEPIPHQMPVMSITGRHGGDVDLPLPPNAGKQTTNFSGSNRNRHRNRSNSGSRNDYYDEFKMPYHPHRGSNRSRCNSQSSNASRENSADRIYSRPGRDQGHRDASRDRYYGGAGRFRQHSRDRYINRSREASMDRGRNADPLHEGGGSWRSIGEIHPPLHHAAADKTVHAIAEMTKQFENSVSIQRTPGVLVLPPKASTSAPDAPSRGVGQRIGAGDVPSEPKLLFDPKNPSRPIVVEQPLLRTNLKTPRMNASREVPVRPGDDTTRARHQAAEGPAWYDPNSRQAKLLRQRDLVYQVAEADACLQDLLNGGQLFADWQRYLELRQELQRLLQTFLLQEMRFAQDVNLEHHFWRLLYYNVVEQLRKLLNDAPNAEEKDFLQKSALEVVENGVAYFEQLLGLLERTYGFNLEQFVGVNAASNVKGLKYTLALVSAQKICLFLGDLARYREQISEGNNFRKSKQWYVKAQQIQPKHGRPYNQLALLSVYAKRKIDAVYFYMRSLMSSNPFESARESLMDLFNETKKKYESNQRKREDKLRARLKEKERRFDGNLRRETWIHPEGGSRVHRTAPLDPLVGGPAGDSSDAEELRGLCSIELNKRFIISFLHVLGKLITKTGMESFSQCVLQMLLEFRALMQYTPIAVTSHRLLQLMSLNMFAIEMMKHKENAPPAASPPGRSEMQECALVAGFLMFGILLERLVQLIRGAMDASSELAGGGTASAANKLILPEDAKAILPSIKVWCDWMMYHTETWNPPPCCSDYKIGNSSAHDPWSSFAELISILKNLDTNREILSLEQKEDYELVRLQEDITLAGFTPLMYNALEPIFVHRERDMEEAQNVLRIQKLIYFGTACLCTCDPPVLSRETSATANGECGPVRFVSVVTNRIEELADMDILLESFSDEELDVSVLSDEPEHGKVQSKVSSSASVEDGSGGAGGAGTALSSSDSGIPSSSNSSCTSSRSLETRKLLRRKDELERKQRMQEKHNQRLQNILSQSTIALNIEVRPRLLVPDTNCFVDYLPAIELIAKAHSLYQLMVPIIVINELEGLSKGIRPAYKHPTSAGSVVSEMIVAKIAAGVAQEPTLPISRGTPVVGDGGFTDPTGPGADAANLLHVAKVAEASKQALLFIRSRNPTVKCVTTKGSVLKTTTFTVEDDVGELKSNDDRILETALNLCRHQPEETRGGTRYVLRDVVLLTTDRNLRVKALSNDLPVRELPDFIKWAGLSA